MFKTYGMILGLLFVNTGLSEELKKYPLELKEGNAESPITPRYSASGTKLKLTSKEMIDLNGFDHLVATVNIREKGQMIALARSKADSLYDILYIDSDLDGSLSDETPEVTIPQLRKNSWWSSFRGRLLTSHFTDENALPKDGNYLASFWVVVDQKDATPEVIRYSGKGFNTGSVDIQSVIHHVFVRDMNNDGFITKGDFWGISAEGIQEKRANRQISDFLWANGKAWKLQLDNDLGTKVTLVEHDPGISQKEDVDARDPFKADREVERATKPLSFTEDYEAAVAKARLEKKSLFIKFETTWCGPCKTMSHLVFTAQDVVTAAKNSICLKVDGHGCRTLR